MELSQELVAKLIKHMLLYGCFPRLTRQELHAVQVALDRARRAELHYNPADPYECIGGEG